MGLIDEETHIDDPIGLVERIEHLRTSYWWTKEELLNALRNRPYGDWYSGWEELHYDYWFGSYVKDTRKIRTTFLKDLAAVFEVTEENLLKGLPDPPRRRAAVLATREKYK